MSCREGRGTRRETDTTADGTPYSWRRPLHKVNWNACMTSHALQYCFVFRLIPRGTSSIMRFFVLTGFDTEIDTSTV